MHGQIYALICALAWAVSTLIIRTQTHHLRPLTLNGARIVLAAIAFGPMLLFFAPQAYLALPVEAWILIASGLIVGQLFGDTMFIRSIALLGAARAMPLTNAFPVATLMASPLITGEVPNLPMALGTGLVAGGVTCIGRGPVQGTAGAKGPPLSKRTARIGVSFALLATLSWAASSCIIRVVFLRYPASDPLLIVAVRGVFLAAICGAWLPFGGRSRELRRLKLTSWMALLATGICGAFLGSVFYVLAISHTSAAQVACLVTTTPLFAVPLAVLFLGERIGRWTVAGMALTTLGAWIVITNTPG